MAEIKISYAATPAGQVGPRPQKIHKGESCSFTCTDPGTLDIEFISGSPTNTNATKFKKGDTFVAEKSGRFRFKCTLTGPDGSKVVVGDPTDPNSGAGGEIEVGT